MHGGTQAEYLGQLPQRPGRNGQTDEQAHGLTLQILFEPGGEPAHGQQIGQGAEAEGGHIECAVGGMAAAQGIQ